MLSGTFLFIPLRDCLSLACTFRTIIAHDVVRDTCPKNV